MIQDIEPYTFHNEYCPVEPEEESFVLLYEDGKALLHKKMLPHGEEISFITVREAKMFLGKAVDFGNADNFSEEKLEWTYLFTIDGMRFYLLSEAQEKLLSRELLEGEKAVAEPIAFFRAAQPQHLAFAGVTGSQMHRWYRSHKFCGKCGNRMVHDEKERMMRCPDCGQMEYPKICPAVIVGVTDGDRIVLTKYAGRAYKKYALIAGFAEVGETIEETVRREVQEEVGLEVKNIRFYKSQPWPFTDTLLMGFFCDLDGPNRIKMDEEELAVAEWCRREDVPADDNDISLTSEMMCMFHKGETVF